MLSKTNRAKPDRLPARCKANLPNAGRCRADLRNNAETQKPAPADAAENAAQNSPENGTPPASPAQTVAQNVIPPLPLEGKRVVICEDEGVTQMQLRRALTRAGLDVVGAATNGQQGVEIALRERPDIVLMDIQMPVMDGLEAARRILEEFSLCVIVLTAFSDPAFLEKAQELGVSGYIIKPVTSDTLLPQIRKGYAAFLNRPN